MEYVVKWDCSRKKNKFTVARNHYCKKDGDKFRTVVSEVSAFVSNPVYLYIQAQMARQAEQDPTNLYIANLAQNIKENDLESLFNPYGQVISTRILRDANQQSRGVGFARLVSRFEQYKNWNVIHMLLRTNSISSLSCRVSHET